MDKETAKLMLQIVKGCREMEERIKDLENRIQSLEKESDQNRGYDD